MNGTAMCNSLSILDLQHSIPIPHRWNLRALSVANKGNRDTSFPCAASLGLLFARFSAHLRRLRVAVLVDPVALLPRLDRAAPVTLRMRRMVSSSWTDLRQRPHAGALLRSRRSTTSRGVRRRTLRFLAPTPLVQQL